MSNKQAQRALIAEHTAAYLASGGVITQCPDTIEEQRRRMEEPVNIMALSEAEAREAGGFIPNDAADYGGGF